VLTWLKSTPEEEEEEEEEEGEGESHRYIPIKGSTHQFSLSSSL
jgi:hypothetical protein